jgi:hypothetical protein
MFLILHGLFLLVMLFKVSLILLPCPVGNRVRQIPLQLRDGHHVNPRGWMVTHYFRTVLDGMTINIPCFDQGLKYRNGWPSIPSISYINIYIYINIPMTISPGLIYHQYTMFWPWRISCFYIVSGPMRPWPLPPGVNGCRECLALLFWDYCGPTQEMSVDNNQMFFTQFKHVQTNGISPVSVDSHMILSN